MAAYETDERIEEAARSDRDAIAERRTIDAERRDVDMDRPEGRRVDGSAAGCLVFAVAVCFPAFLYFGFFGAVLLDEMVLETYWLSEAIPEPALEVLRVLYMPLLWVLDQFDG